mmetsp:Transcript_75211/g.126546  ORF Transcript_75211/g.126546 Transcript_75211/m.126546 type:complete len:80 (-) Transcript_75211:650-889(-)
MLPCFQTTHEPQHLHGSASDCVQQHTVRDCCTFGQLLTGADDFCGQCRRKQLQHLLPCSTVTETRMSPVIGLHGFAGIL